MLPSDCDALHGCGRIDEHSAHDWSTPPLGANYPQRTHHCTGRVVIEGGHRELMR